MTDDQLEASGTHDAAEGSTANVVYILYLVSIVVGVTSIVGVIMAYINRSEAPEWVQSHYTFQIRTFWIGLLFGLICVVTLFIFIGWILMLLLLVWYIVRCAKGMKYIANGQTHPNVESWMFG